MKSIFTGAVHYLRGIAVYATILKMTAAAFADELPMPVFNGALKDGRRTLFILSLPEKGGFKTTSTTKSKEIFNVEIIDYDEVTNTLVVTREGKPHALSLEAKPIGHFDPNVPLTRDEALYMVEAQLRLKAEGIVAPMLKPANEAVFNVQQRRDIAAARAQAEARGFLLIIGNDNGTPWLLRVQRMSRVRLSRALIANLTANDWEQFDRRFGELTFARAFAKFKAERRAQPEHEHASK